jgi:hypothetical protein
MKVRLFCVRHFDLCVRGSAAYLRVVRMYFVNVSYYVCELS